MQQRFAEVEEAVKVKEEMGEALEEMEEEFQKGVRGGDKKEMEASGEEMTQPP